jgi:pleckstrin family protein M 2
MQYLFSTGSNQTTSELITHLEIAMRRSPFKPRLPAVKELYYDDMHSLKHSILAETAVHPVMPPPDVLNSLSDNIIYTKKIL